MNGWQRLHPKGTRLRFLSSEGPYRVCSSHESIDYNYAIEHFPPKREARQLLKALSV